MSEGTKARRHEGTKWGASAPVRDRGASASRRCEFSGSPVCHVPFAIRHSRSAALLLEVIIALGIMVTAMAFVGAQLVGGMQYVSASDQQARAGELADRMLALLELDMSRSSQLIEDLYAEGDFEEQHPGYMWRAYVTPLTDVEGLNQVTLEILYQGEPELQTVSDIDKAGVVQRLHLLKADPGRLDLEADFGVPAEQVEQLGDLIPIPGFDPTQLDPQMLMSLPPEELLAMIAQLMPLLQSQFGNMPGMPDVQNMSAEELQAFILEQMAARGGQGGPAQQGAVGDVAGGEGDFEQGPPAGRSGRDGPPGLEELFELQRQFEQNGTLGGASQGGARGGRGGVGRGGSGATGGRRGGGGTRGGNTAGQNAGGGGSQDPMGIGDLDALRDRLNDAANRGGSNRGNRAAGGNRGGRGAGGRRP